MDYRALVADIRAGRAKFPLERAADNVEWAYLHLKTMHKLTKANVGLMLRRLEIGIEKVEGVWQVRWDRAEYYFSAAAQLQESRKTHVRHLQRGNRAPP